MHSTTPPVTARNSLFLYGGVEALTRVGPFVGYERSEADLNPDQDAFQGGARVEWDYSALTSLHAQIGVDARDFEGGGSSEDIVWSVGLDWRPDDMFTMNLALSRLISPSIILANQNFTSTAISLGLQKDIFNSYYVRLVGDYAWADYDATGSGRPPRVRTPTTAPMASSGENSGLLGLWGCSTISWRTTPPMTSPKFSNDSVGLRLSIDF